MAIEQRHGDADKRLYGLLASWCRTCLELDTSLFSSGRPIWTRSNLDALRKAFTEQPDESSDSFLAKLQRQLANAPDDVIQLFGEMLYVHLLIARDIGGRAKRDNLALVAELMDEPWSLNDELNSALDHGLVNTGVAYKTYRPQQLWLLIDFAIAFKEQPTEERQRLLDEPWSFKSFLEGIPQQAAYTQFNGLLHMVHPETFEDCVSREHKAAMVAAIRDRVADDTDDVDRALLQIRHSLEVEAGHPISFYDETHRRLWDPGLRRPWDRLAQFAPTVLGWDEFDESERHYKLAFAEAARPHLQAPLSADGVQAFLHELGRVNLVDFRVRDTFQKWAVSDPEVAVKALDALLGSDGPLEGRVDEFAKHAANGAATRGSALSLASAVLLATNPEQHPIYRSRQVEAAFGLLGRSIPRGLSYGEEYAHFVALLDEAAFELAERGIDVRDRLSGQSLLWVLTQQGLDEAPLDRLSDDDARAFLAWRGDVAEVDEPTAGPIELASEDERRSRRIRQLVEAFAAEGRQPFLADDRQAEQSRQAVREALDELERSEDLAAFAAWVRSSRNVHPHIRMGAHQTYLGSLAKQAPDPAEAARLVVRAYRLDGDVDEEALESLASYAGQIGTSSAPAAGMTPLAASAFWSLQDPRLPPLYASSEDFLRANGWLPSSDSVTSRYEQYRRALAVSSVDPMWAAEVTAGVRNAWFAGLDPCLVERCEENAAILRADDVTDVLRQRSQRNAEALVGDLKLAGSALRKELSALVDQPLHVAMSGTPTNERGLSRADGFVSWRLEGDEHPPSIRIWVAPEGVAVGIHPGAVKGRNQRASQIAVERCPDDMAMILPRFATDRPRELLSSTVAVTDSEFMIGHLLPADEALGTVTLADQLTAAVGRLLPLLRAWSNEFGGLMAPSTVTDDDLTADVEAFLRERGYPLPKDRQALEHREEFARALAPEAFEAFDVDALRSVANSRRYGFTGPQSVLNVTLSESTSTGLQQIADAVHYLLWGDGEVADRVDALLDEAELKVRGLGESVIWKLLSVVHPDRFIPVFPLRGDMGKLAFLDLLGLPAPNPSGSVGAQHVEANDRLRERLEPFFPGDPNGMREFLYWRLTWEGAAEHDDVDLIQEAADDLHVSLEFLNEIVALLREKRQVIFYGPPGTGKTYLAKRLARALVGNDEQRVRVVQFHPSYAYEDFFEGYRPRVTDDGQMVYELRHGPLAAMAEQADAAPGAEHVMVVDEINRANLPKVFGELLFLLEYRDEPTYTQYRSDTPFTLPKKLYFLGTMNTADRSIALIDAALRRRFHFVPFFPHDGEIAGLLRKWLEDNELETWVADLVDLVNADLREDLQGPHLQIGPSYFMVDDLDEERLQRVWTYSVFPYIEEQLFGQDELIAQYRYDAVMQRYRASLAPMTDVTDGSDHA